MLTRPLKLANDFVNSSLEWRYRRQESDLYHFTQLNDSLNIANRFACKQLPWCCSLQVKLFLLTLLKYLLSICVQPAEAVTDVYLELI